MPQEFFFVERDRHHEENVRNDDGGREKDEGVDGENGGWGEKKVLTHTVFATILIYLGQEIRFLTRRCYDSSMRHQCTLHVT